jgi:hypothetical protein
MKIKHFVSFVLVFGVVVLLSQTAAAQFGTTAVNNFPNCDRNMLSPIKCGYYEEGFQDGVNDARANRDSDHRRYRSKFENQYESFYRNGYDAGFQSARPGSNWTNQQRSAYDQGYGFGANDRGRGISRLPARYEGRYDRNYEAFYQKGYFDGYDNRPRQYDTPIGNVPPFPLPNPGGNRPPVGTASGTLTWNGKVDNRVHIILQGNQVETRNLAGSLSGVYHNLQGALPRRNATVSVTKLDGRGTVRVVQQPNRSNQFTAIAEIYDSQRSDDNYNLRINWTASNVQEQYTSGRLVWRGRVDATVNIRIAGDFVEALDETGSGLTVLRSDLTGYLAARNGTVRVDKKDGRGTVSVVEQPSARNDYTAVIRIFDPRGGDDEYELEVTW